MKIFSVDNRFFYTLEILTNFFLLNLLWIILCIPIITIFPATAAMFGVVRQWYLKKDSSVFRLFFSYFKENFRSSFGIGILWLIAVIMLLLDLYFVFNIETNLKYIFYPIFALIGFLFILTTTFLFPVIVHYNLDMKDVVKNSFILGISHLHVVFFTILIGVVLFGIFIFLPILFLIIFSAGSYFIYSLCHRSFLKIENQKSIEEKGIT